MDYLRQIEEDIKNIGNEAKSKFPLVKEAADKALVSLKIIRDSYVSDIMKRTNDEKSIKFPQSSDILSPFMLACNYAECTTKLITLALNGILTLLNYGMIPPGDVKNILRVLSIQASSPKFDMQLKLLQILLHMANSLSHDSESSQYLTESTVCSFLTLSLQICDGRGSVSVASAALGTVRQLIALIMDGALAVLLKNKDGLSVGFEKGVIFSASVDQSSSSLVISATLLVRDMALFVQGVAGGGDWIRSAAIPQSFALDLMYEILSGWKLLFQHVPAFRSLLRECICPALKPLLRGLQEDFVVLSARQGVTVAAAFTSRVVRIARCVLLNYCCAELYADAEFILTLLVHSLQPDRGAGGASDSVLQLQVPHSHDSHSRSTLKGGSSPKYPAGSSNSGAEDPTFRSRFEDASSLIIPGGASALISRLTMPMSMAAGAISNNLKNMGGNGGAPPGHSGGRPNLAGLAGISGFYIPLASASSAPQHATPLSAVGTSSLPSANGNFQIPSHPAALCLETLLSFLTSGSCAQAVSPLKSDPVGLHLLETLLVNVSVSVSGLLISALSVEANARELDAGMKGSPLHPLLKALLSGHSAAQLAGGSSADQNQKGASSDSSGEHLCRGVHDHLMASTGAKHVEVFMLALALLQVVPRMLLKEALLLSFYGPSSGGSELQVRQISGSAFLPTSLKGLLPLSPKDGLATYQDAGPALRASTARACDYVYESTLDACSLLLNALENSSIVRMALGVVSELALSVGILGLSKPCEIVVSVLCRYTVPMWHGQELFNSALELQMQGAVSTTTSTGSSSIGGAAASAVHFPEAIRWRHVQAIVRLLQVVHTLADVISDWDSVVDSLEQIVGHCSSPRSPLSSASGPASPPPGGSKHEVTAVEVDKVLAAVERFKLYSVFLSDDALVKLMTSLVALSMNNLAVSATAMHSGLASGSAGDAISRLGGAQSSAETSVPSVVNQARLKLVADGPEYISEGIRTGAIGFSLQAVIEITKLNAFRISAVWQMVTSHLRMIASLKSPQSRMVSVAATHDVIETSLRYLQNPVSPIASITFMKEEAFATVPPGRSGGGVAAVVDCLLSEDSVFNHVLPSFETAFVGRDFHRLLSFSRNQVLLHNPKLSQSDLLSSLRALATVRYSDVRNAILSGLSDMLQRRGQNIDEGGWLVIVDILESVPASMSTENFLSEVYNEPPADGCDGLSGDPAESGVDFDAIFLAESASSAAAISASRELCTPAKRAPPSSFSGSLQSPALPQYQWPEESLRLAFTCMQLIVEDFLDRVLADSEIVQGLLQCLSVFSSQLKEVNISLTSLELLWKVTDLAIKRAAAPAVPGEPAHSQAVLGSSSTVGPQYVEAVLDAMLKRLSQLAMDSRPEIRHCAIDTLFLAMAAHAPIISCTQWRQVFERIVFPLFEKTGARSQLAMRSNEEAAAPELKKGVRMNVHHSRDTAHKQWSETRVKALQGLTKVLRTCSAILLEEPWFREVWADSISVCHGALQSALEDHEVAVAGLDVVVSMLKIVIQLDSAVPARKPAAVTPGSKHHKEEQNGRRQSADKSELLERESLERSKALLWKLAWTALHDSAFFSCASLELAFCITQKLAELYRSRMDHEFRYSDNVRVLLEIVVTLARPRLAISGDGGPVDAVSSKQNRVADGQLQRALMDLLREMQPTTDVVYALLLSAVTEICFAFQCVQVVSPLTGETLLLGPVADKLRVEAGEHLLLIQDSLTSSAQRVPAQPEDGGEQGRPKYHMRFSNPKAFCVMLEVVARRFVLDICAGPLSSRGTNTGSSAVSFLQLVVGGTTNQSDVAPASASPSSAGGGGFFSSFANMMTTSAASSTAGGEASSHGHQLAHNSSLMTNKSGGTQHLHTFRAYLPSQAELAAVGCGSHTFSFAAHGASAGERDWRTFFCVRQESMLLVRTLNCFRISGGDVAAEEGVSEAVWRQVVVCVACLLSPWRAAEISSDGEACSPSEADLSEQTDSIVALLESALLLARSPPRIAQLVAVLARSSVLSVLSVCEGSGPSPNRSLLSASLRVWQKTRVVLTHVFKSSAQDLAARKCALHHLLWVCTAINRLVHRFSDAALPAEVYAICFEYLSTLAELDVPLSLLDQEGCGMAAELVGSEREQSVNLLVRAWWSAVADTVDAAGSRLTAEEAAGSVSSPPRRQSSTRSSSVVLQAPELSSEASNTLASIEETGGGNKSHLLLLMGSAVDLATSCRDAQVKEAAASVVRGPDMHQLVVRLARLTARNAELETRNKALNVELMSVKSAASLPF